MAALENYMLASQFSKCSTLPNVPRILEKLSLMPFLAVIFYILMRLNLLIVFCESSITLLISCMLVLSVSKRRMLKYLFMILDLSASVFNSVDFCLICFKLYYWVPIYLRLLYLLSGYVLSELVSLSL